jgi:phosphoglycerate dehydrogenase-like enzyme
VPFRILVTDEIDPDGVALLTAEPQFVVDEVPTLPRDELLARIDQYDAFVGRSATRITDELLHAATRLRVVGRAGVGVDNIALDTATELGIAVINAPAGNTIAVAELFFGTVLGLLRHLPHAAVSMRDGKWDRAQLLGTELKGKTLVIVGVGRIGGEIATRALAFGMDVAGYDPYVSDERFRSLRVRRLATLEEGLDEADFLTVHTPLTEETDGMIGRRELARLKSGAIVVNMARGGIVEEGALVAALERRTRCSPRTSARRARKRSGTWRWTRAPLCVMRCCMVSCRAPSTWRVPAPGTFARCSPRYSWRVAPPRWRGASWPTAAYAPSSGSRCASGPSSRGVPTRSSRRRRQVCSKAPWTWSDSTSSMRVRSPSRAGSSWRARSPAHSAMGSPCR